MTLYLTLTNAAGTVLTDPGNTVDTSPFNGIRIPGRTNPTAYPAGSLFGIQSIQNGLGSAYTIGSSGPTVGKTSFSEITISCNMGQLAPTLFIDQIKGVLFSYVDIWVAQVDGGTPIPHQFFGTAETAVTGLSWSSGGDLPSESASFNYGKLWIGSLAATGTKWNIHGWDRTANKQIG